MSVIIPPSFSLSWLPALPAPLTFEQPFPFQDTFGFGPAVSTPPQRLVASEGMLKLGSPDSRVGRMKHTLAERFGSLGQTPVPLLALVCHHDRFRMSDSGLRRFLSKAPGFLFNLPHAMAYGLIRANFVSNPSLARRAITELDRILERLWVTDAREDPFFPFADYYTGHDNHLPDMTKYEPPPFIHNHFFWR